MTVSPPLHCVKLLSSVSGILDLSGMETRAGCECCGLVETCTLAYVQGIQRAYSDHFICGLCEAAVKEEQRRSTEAPLPVDTAVARCKRTRLGSNALATKETTGMQLAVVITAALRHILRKNKPAPPG